MFIPPQPGGKHIEFEVGLQERFSSHFHVVGGVDGPHMRSIKHRFDTMETPFWIKDPDDGGSMRLSTKEQD